MLGGLLAKNVYLDKQAEKKEIHNVNPS
jgi:hypothetical protein